MLITITDDMDLSKIIDSGQCFRAARRPDGRYRFIYKNHILYILPKRNNVYQCSVSERDWNNWWRDYFDLGRSYSDIRNAIPETDRFLHNAADLGKGIRILHQDPWEMLITFIISQRKSIPAIRKAVENLCTLAGKKKQTRYETIRLFPTPAALYKCTKEELDSCGLGYRTPYVMDAAAKVYRHEIDLEKMKTMSDEELLQELITIKGVGIKVANCAALFAYQRTTLAPIDVWIARVIDKYYKGKNPFPGWKDKAGILQQYMFYAAIHQ